MNQPVIECVASGRIPTEMGIFQLRLYHNTVDHKEHLALVMGEVTNHPSVLGRIHSECFTGDVLGSRRCDCGPQLEQAMRMIAEEGSGLILYLRQEGRGIGLADKLRAYNLQDQGYDTVDANLMLGHQADARDYTVAAWILQDLGVTSLRLLTNNPTKVEGLKALGLTNVERVPLPPLVTLENTAYLMAKVKRMRHLLHFDLLPAPFSAEAKESSLPTLLPASPTTKRPFVTLSYAQSIDGSLTYRRGTSMALSGKESRRITHQLRANHDGILVGIGTVLADNPRLTVRLVEGTHAHPQPIILDSQLRLPVDAALVQSHPLRPWVATTTDACSARAEELEAAGVKILRLPPNAEGQVDLHALLRALSELGIESLMVEGGAQILTSFFKERLVERLVVTIAPLLVGGLSPIEQPLSGLSNGFPRLREPQYRRVGSDMLLFGDVVWEEE